MKPYTLDEVLLLPLDRVTKLYEEQKVPEQIVKQYVDKWNTGSFRFTKAVVVAGSIYQFNIDREDEHMYSESENKFSPFYQE